MYRKDQQGPEVAVKFTMERNGSQRFFLLLKELQGVLINNYLMHSATFSYNAKSSAC